MAKLIQHDSEVRAIRRELYQSAFVDKKIVPTKEGLLEVDQQITQVR